MISDFRSRISDWRLGSLIRLCLLSSVLSLPFLTGCSTVSRRAPGRTVVEVKATVLPARIISNFFVIESKQEDGSVYRFLIDTGSTVSYVSPALAKRIAVKTKKDAVPQRVRVLSASGGEVELEATILRKLWLGESLFERVVHEEPFFLVGVPRIVGPKEMITAQNLIIPLEPERRRLDLPNHRPFVGVLDVERDPVLARHLFGVPTKLVNAAGGMAWIGAGVVEPSA